LLDAAIAIIAAVNERAPAVLQHLNHCRHFADLPSSRKAKSVTTS
jgi:hypothetical protein